MSEHAIFANAFKHCRSKTTLRNTLRDHIDVNSYAGKSFEDVFIDIDRICRDVDGLGILTIYDITMGILKYHGVVLDVTFLVGSGDIQGAKQSGLDNLIKTVKVGRHKLKYIENIYLRELFS